MSKRMFQRAATFAHNAGISLSHTHDHGRQDKDGLNEQGIDKRYVQQLLSLLLLPFDCPPCSVVCGQVVQGCSSSSLGVVLVVCGQEVQGRLSSLPWLLLLLLLLLSLFCYVFVVLSPRVTTGSVLLRAAGPWCCFPPPRLNSWNVVFGVFLQKITNV